ncbi:hypothetical protein [Chryseobacterium sp. H1D6B]|uniref:hypothetical protein n=1 Tax=Chryseobacterium sp. H1D6B TaxID=2940588 RepID=UPI0015C6B79B|nr:hypothetical protein [Chryseobacterium sp. H1D6B]
MILLVAFATAGVLSAKDVDLKKEKEKEKTEIKTTNQSEAKGPSGPAMLCTSVGMFVWCTNEVITDTVCWGGNSGTATYQQAMADSIHNAQLLTEFYCGTGSGSGPGGN